MVTETKESMAQMFDTVAETTRASMEAGRRMQESWFEAVGAPGKECCGFEGFFAQNERVAKEFFPFMGRNMQAMAESLTTSFQAGMDLFKTATDTTMKSVEVEPYRRSREMWETAFGTVRTNFNAMNKAGRRIMENWATFCGTGCCDSGAPKPAPKSTK